MVKRNDMTGIIWQRIQCQTLMQPVSYFPSVDNNSMKSWYPRRSYFTVSMQFYMTLGVEMTAAVHERAQYNAVFYGIESSFSFIFKCQLYVWKHNKLPHIYLLYNLGEFLEPALYNSHHIHMVKNRCNNYSILPLEYYHD